MSYFDERIQVRPIDNEKIQELHARLKMYRVEGYGQKNQPWNKEICIELGVIFFKAWGVMPISRRMEFIYGLPNNKVIKKIFGSFEVFYAQIYMAINKEVVDVAQIQEV